MQRSKTEAKLVPVADESGVDYKVTGLTGP